MSKTNRSESKQVQMHLFKSKPCDVCGRQVYTKPPYHALYDGVRNMGTGQFRCWPCNRLHHAKTHQP